MLRMSEQRTPSNVISSEIQPKPSIIQRIQYKNRMHLVWLGQQGGSSAVVQWAKGRNPSCPPARLVARDSISIPI